MKSEGEQLRLLSELARELSARADDPEALASRVARRLGETFGDLCLLRLVTEDGLLDDPGGAIYHPDPEIVALTRQATASHRQGVGEGISGRVAATGVPALIPVVDTVHLLAHLHPARRSLVERQGITSVVAAPLLSRGRVVAVISLSRSDPRHPHDEGDLRLVQDVAALAALAIDNARQVIDPRAPLGAEALLAAIVQSSNDAIISKTLDGTITSWNGAAERLFGYTAAEAVGQRVTMLIPSNRLDEERRIIARIAAGERVDHYETARVRKDGSEAIVSISVAPVLDRSGRVVGASKTARDLTGQRKAAEALRRTEDQLRQAQKMEAVGRLAGGIAHDFNNMLSVILSYSEMLLDELEPNDPTAADLEEIRRAGTRAADLTRQLLTFSRQQAVEVKVLDLNELLAGMTKMLKRVLGEDIDLASVPASRVGRISADPSSVEQLVMNLVVNSRDAMPTGGKLTIETADVELDAEYAREHLGCTPGPYVMLAVTDTGVGMDRATQARIFEPFFTTKGLGKGTGLGLSTVFGIAQQSGGSVWVYSEPGRGTTFKVYFPRVEGTKDATVPATTPLSVRGHETILLVEDEEQVRAVARGILKRHGYQVLVAGSPGEAILLSEAHAGVIHLLLTDVVMPQMSGAELAKRITKGRPDAKVLCMSGYTDDSVVRHGVLEGGIAFLQKPLTPESLTRKVREVLSRLP